MNWYYHDETKQFGPFDAVQIVELIKNGTIKPHTQVWKEGTPAWSQASATELAQYLVQAPPSWNQSIPALPSSPITSPPTAPISLGQKTVMTGMTASQPESAYMRKPESLKTRWRTMVILFIVGILLCFIPLLSDNDLATYALHPAVATLFGGGILWFMLLYRYWKIIQDGKPRTTAGKAVGFCFIPLFNFYWMYVALVGLAKDMNTYCRERKIPAKVNEGLALASYILNLLPMFLSGDYKLTTGCIGVVLVIIFSKQCTDAAIMIIKAKQENKTI